MTSTVAGISRGVRPSRVALSAGDSVLSGVSRSPSTTTGGSLVCAAAGNTSKADVATASANMSPATRPDSFLFISPEASQPRKDYFFADGAPAPGSPFPAREYSWLEICRRAGQFLTQDTPPARGTVTPT